MKEMLRSNTGPMALLSVPQGALQLEWAVGVVSCWIEMASPSYPFTDQFLVDGFLGNEHDVEQGISLQVRQPCT